MFTTKVDNFRVSKDNVSLGITHRLVRCANNTGRERDEHEEPGVAGPPGASAPGTAPGAAAPGAAAPGDIRCEPVPRLDPAVQPAGVESANAHQDAWRRGAGRKPESPRCRQPRGVAEAAVAAAAAGPDSGAVARRCTPDEPEPVARAARRRVPRDTRAAAIHHRQPEGAESKPSAVSAQCHQAAAAVHGPVSSHRGSPSQAASSAGGSRAAGWSDRRGGACPTVRSTRIDTGPC